MGMSGGMRALLGFAKGSANKYQEIQDTQRKYKLEQKSLDAQSARQLNFKRKGMEIEKQMAGSGMVDEFGKEISNEEYALLGLEEQKKYKSKQAQQQQLDIDKEVQIRDIRDAEKPSQFMDPKTKKVLSKGEVKEMTEAGAIEGEDFVTVTAYKEGREETEKAEATASATKAATAKAEQTLRTDFRKEVMKNISPETEEADKHMAVEQAIQVYGTEGLKDEPLLKEYKKTEDIVVNLATAKSKGISKKNFIAEMEKSGFSKKEIEKAFKVAVKKGVLKEGIFGYKGRSW